MSEGWDWAGRRKVNDKEGKMSQGRAVGGRGERGMNEWGHSGGVSAPCRALTRRRSLTSPQAAGEAEPRLPNASALRGAGDRPAEPLQLLPSS